MTETKRQELIERIARAMAASDGRFADEPHNHKAPEHCGPLVWHLYVVEAGHALAAHRAMFGDAALDSI